METWIMGVNYIDRTCSYDQYITFLILGGVDIERWEGEKSLLDLWQEVKIGDAKLRLVCKYYILRIALSVQVLIRIGESGCILEEKRIFNTGNTLFTNRAFSFSETRRYLEVSGLFPTVSTDHVLENPFRTTIRGTKEEMGVKIRRNRVTQLSTHDEVDEHRSSVFPPQIRSKVLFRRFVVSFRSCPRDVKLEQDDNGVTICRKFHPEMPERTKSWMRRVNPAGIRPELFELPVGDL